MKKELLYRVTDRLQHEVEDLSRIPSTEFLEILMEEIEKYVEEKTNVCDDALMSPKLRKL